VAVLSTAEVLGRLARELGRPVGSIDPAHIRAELAGHLGLPWDQLEGARERRETWPARRDLSRPLHLRAIRLNSTAPTPDVHPYASLDSYVDRRLAEMGLPRP
jgi:hypothetical protein